MSVQVSAEFLFAELGRLYAECKVLTADNERLRAELADKEALLRPTT